LRKPRSPRRRRSIWRECATFSLDPVTTGAVRNHSSKEARSEPRRRTLSYRYNAADASRASPIRCRHQGKEASHS
jgi:hypothetical protein